jgi:hypothetical protein
MFLAPSGKGTLIIWIKNYNSPCISNNTTNCEHFTLKVKSILLNNKVLDNDIRLNGGEFWNTKIKVSEGKYTLKLMEDNGYEALAPPIKVEKDKTICMHFPWSNTINVYTNVSHQLCPP